MSEWISIKDRVPIEGEGNVIIIYNGKGEVVVGWRFECKLNEESGNFPYNDLDCAEGYGIISHWMPLPNPPEKP